MKRFSVVVVLFAIGCDPCSGGSGSGNQDGGQMVDANIPIGKPDVFCAESFCEGERYATRHCYDGPDGEDGKSRPINAYCVPQSSDNDCESAAWQYEDHCDGPFVIVGEPDIFCHESFCEGERAPNRLCFDGPDGEDGEGRIIRAFCEPKTVSSDCETDAIWRFEDECEGTVVTTGEGSGSVAKSSTANL